MASVFEMYQSASGMLLSGSYFESTQYFAQLFLPSLDAQSEYVGGVGKLVAAALQSKGLIDQAKILQEFKDSLETIAALAWLFAIAMGVGAAAIFGSYRQGLYLLVGPTFFYFMINTTVGVDGVNTLVGKRKLEGDKIKQATLLQWIGVIGNAELAADEGGEGQTISGLGSAEVSFFFALYDSIITEAVQAVVGVILDETNKKDLRAIARERAMNFVLMTRPEDAGLVSLIIKEHLGQCGDITQGYMPQYAIKNKITHQYSDTTSVENSETRSNDLMDDPRIELDESTRAYLLKEQAKTPEGETYPEVPFTSAKQNIPVSCQQIWDWLAASLERVAKHHLKPEVFQASAEADDYYPWDEAYQDIEDALESGGNEAAKMLAVYIYKNAVTLSTHAGLQSTITSRSPVSTSKKHEAIYGNVTDAEAHGGYMKLVYFSTAIPYMQGMLLYILSIAFPFFAILLVVPGKATTFFAWCGLWAWVKSWDIGFALVDVARDIFWVMLKGRINSYEDQVDWSLPTTVLRVAFNNDPLANQNTMWILISAMTVAVPMLTAHLILGASGMYDMFKYSIDQTANRFGLFESKRARRHAANKIEKEQRAVKAALAHKAYQMHMRKAQEGKLSTAPGETNESIGGKKLNDGFTDDLNNNHIDVSGASGLGQDVGQMLSVYEFMAQNGAGGGYMNALQAQGKDAAMRQAAENAASGTDKTGSRPEFRLPHVMRGTIDFNSKLPTEDLDGSSFVDDAEGQVLFAGATEEQKQRARDGEMTFGEMLEMVNSRNNDLGDALATVTGRRQYVVKENGEGGARAMLNALERRIYIDRNARAPMDGSAARYFSFGEAFVQAVSGSSSDIYASGIKYAPNPFNVNTTDALDRTVKTQSSGDGEPEESGESE